jgi:hypothetical protein
MQPVDSSQDPLDGAAWAVAGTSVLFLAWHLIPQLCTAWQKLGIPGGMPPCPCCWQQQVEVAPGKQLTVQESYKQLDAAEIKRLQTAKQLGVVQRHGCPRLFRWARWHYSVACSLTAA